MKNPWFIHETLNDSMKISMKNKSWGTMDVFMASVVP